jgi:cytochrome b pre-mRNA-processing protein 3
VNILSRLFGKSEDDRAIVRPLWQRVVELARQPEWYADCGIADTMPGRFDAVAMVLSLVMLRMEQDPALTDPSVRLSELFVEDMEGQLRNNGVGDLVVGKQVGKLMSALGGRLGSLREALAQDDAALTEAVARNTTMIERGDPGKVAVMLRALAARLDVLSAEDVLAGKIPA